MEKGVIIGVWAYNLGLAAQAGEWRWLKGQSSMGIHDWHPCRDAEFKRTLSGGVASLNHRLQYVMPPASRLLVSESGACQRAKQNAVSHLKYAPFP